MFNVKIIYRNGLEKQYYFVRDCKITNAKDNNIFVTISDGSGAVSVETCVDVEIN